MPKRRRFGLQEAAIRRMPDMSIALAFLVPLAATGPMLALPVAVQGMIDDDFCKDSADGVNAGFGADRLGDDAQRIVAWLLAAPNSRSI